LAIPAGFTNQEVDLLGRLVIHGHETLSKPVKVLFDGAPPTVYVDEIPPYEIGEPVKVFIRADDENGSDIREVKAAFATPGADLNKVDWQAANRDGDGWLVELKTEKLSIGRQTILVHVEDKVGYIVRVRREVSLVAKQDVVAPPPEKEAAKQSPENIVSGHVAFGDQRVRAKVELKSAAGAAIAPQDTQDDGAFTFRQVPPGSYTITARSKDTLRGYFRESKGQAIVVPAFPEQVAPVAIKLQ
jgi:hypothetical protein